MAWPRLAGDATRAMECIELGIALLNEMLSEWARLKAIHQQFSCASSTTQL